MVKGISRQVILVHSPETDIFEQAIFILKDNADAVTDEMLLKEAKRLLNAPKIRRKFSGLLWAGIGAVLTGILWLLTIFL